MSVSVLRHLVVILVPVALAACNDGFRSQAVDRDMFLATNAEFRAITRTKIGQFTAGRVTPKFIVCTEPSPDIAKVVSESFSADAEIAAEIAGKGGGSAALSLARARAEAVAQMTERLATI